MKKLTLGIVIGVVLSFIVLGFVGKPIMAEQNRMQFHDYYRLPDGPLVWVFCDTAIGNLVYVSASGTGVAMWGQPNQCSKTQK